MSKLTVGDRIVLHVRKMERATGENWTYERIAEGCDVSEEAVKGWMHPYKASIPQPKNMIALARLLDTTVEELTSPSGSEVYEDAFDRVEKIVAETRKRLNQAPEDTAAPEDKSAQGRKLFRHAKGFGGPPREEEPPAPGAGGGGE